MCKFSGFAQAERVVGHRGQGREAQLLLIGRDEQLDATAHASLLGHALRELLHEIASKIAERVSPIRVARERGSIETVLVDEPNENRLAALSESQHEEWDGCRSRFCVWIQGANRVKFEQNVFGLDWCAQAFASRHCRLRRTRARYERGRSAPMKFSRLGARSPPGFIPPRLDETVQQRPARKCGGRHLGRDALAENLYR